MLLSAAFAAGALLATPAQADTIELKVAPPPGAQPSQADLGTSFQLGETAFVGTVLLPGSWAGCPAGYAQAMAELGAYSVLDGERHPTLPPVSGEGQGELVTLPAGAFSICGWVQPGGPTAPASAAAGPVQLSVGGPTGSTDVMSPAVPQPESVQIPVSYTLALGGGEIPGLATASISVSASPAGSGSCGAEATSTVVQLGTRESRALSSPGAPVQGTLTFTGRLRPGAWVVCAGLVQTFAVPAAGLPNQVNPIEFALSAGTVTVLGPPQLLALRPRRRVLRRGRSPVFSFTLDQPAEVTLRLGRLVRGSHGASRRCLSDPATGGRLCGHIVCAGVSRVQANAGTSVRTLGAGLHGRRLAPGVYLLSAVARGVDGTGAPATSVFAVRG